MEIKINDEELKELSYKLLDIKPMVSLVTNYLDGLAMCHENEQDWAVIHSLFNNNGLDNARSTLDTNAKKLNELVDKILELAGEH